MDGHDQPTALKRADNFAQANVRRAAKWHRCQSNAEAIWENHPKLSRLSVARLVKKRLQLSEQAQSIARRIRK
jgi:hypothetical protein